MYIPFFDSYICLFGWKTVSDTSGIMGVSAGGVWANQGFNEHLSPDFVDQNSHHSGMASSPFAKLSDFLARQIPADPHSDWHYPLLVHGNFRTLRKRRGMIWSGYIS